MSRRFPAPFPALFLAALASVSAAAAALPSAAPPPAFAAALRRALDADASWVMTKRMRSPALTLTSSGEVSCFAGKGIVWMPTAPFMRQIRMTARGISFLSERGAETRPPGEIPHYGQIREAAERFLAGECGDFSRLFSWEWEKGAGGKGWRITILPKRPDMRRFIEKAVAEGGAALDRVTLSYAAGETVRIEFRETARGGHSLWK